MNSAKPAPTRILNERDHWPTAYTLEREDDQTARLAVGTGIERGTNSTLTCVPQIPLET